MPEDWKPGHGGPAKGGGGRPGHGPARGGPASGSWQQFPVEHGAYQALDKLRNDPRVIELADEIRESMPVVSPADKLLVLMAAVTFVRIERGTAAIAIVDAQADQTGDLVAAAQQYEVLRRDLRAWIGTGRQLLNDLGCSPMSRAKLGLTLAQTEDALDRLTQVGAEVRARADARRLEGGGGTERH